MNFLAGMLLVLLMIPIAIVRGIVLTDLWQWFVTPLGVSGISTPQAIGLALIIGFLVPIKDQSEADDDVGVWTLGITYFLGSVFAAGLTWITGAVVASFL